MDLSVARKGKNFLALIFNPAEIEAGFLNPPISLAASPVWSSRLFLAHTFPSCPRIIAPEIFPVPTSWSSTYACQDIVSISVAERKKERILKRELQQVKY